MEKLFGSLSLGDILRRFFAGGVLVFVFVASRNRAGDTDWIGLVGRFGVGHLALAVVSGSLIYAVHRGAVSIVTEHLRYGAIWGMRECKWLGRFFWPHKAWELIFQRWFLSEGVRSDESPRIDFSKVAGHIFKWGDNIALLYTSGWSYLLGRLLATWSGNGASLGWDALLVPLVLLGTAFIEDCRKQMAEELLYGAVYEEFPSGQMPLPPVFKPTAPASSAAPR